MARRIVAALTRQDYTGAIFVRDGLGRIPGALPTSAVNLARRRADAERRTSR